MNPEAFPQPAASQEPKLPKSPTIGDKVFNFLDRTKFLELRRSDEQFEAWFQNLSYEKFSSYLTQINGMLRDTPIKKRSVDGRTVEISRGSGWGPADIVYLPPAAEQKGTLMQETFEAMKRVRDNGDRALLAYYALQAIHPYADGNGRTGRLFHELMAEGSKDLDKEKLLDLVNHDEAGTDGVGKGRAAFAKKLHAPETAYYLINRELVKDVFGEDFLKKYGRIYYSGYTGAGSVPDHLKISQEEKVLAGKIIGEGGAANFGFQDIVILKLLQENGKLGECALPASDARTKKEVVPEDVGKEIFGIDDEKFLASLTEADVKRLIEIHKEIKAKFIRELIDIFEHPEAHRTPENDGTDTTIKDALHNR